MHYLAKQGKIKEGRKKETSDRNMFEGAARETDTLI